MARYSLITLAAGALLAGTLAVQAADLPPARPLPHATAAPSIPETGPADGNRIVQSAPVSGPALGGAELQSGPDERSFLDRYRSQIFYGLMLLGLPLLLAVARNAPKKGAAMPEDRRLLPLHFWMYQIRVLRRTISPATFTSPRRLYFVQGVSDMARDQQSSSPAPLTAMVNNVFANKAADEAASDALTPDEARQMELNFAKLRQHMHG